MRVHKLLKDVFTWSMENKLLTIAASWEEVIITTQKICLKQIPWMDLMEEMKVWNPKRNFKVLEERETRIRENQESIKDIKSSLYMEEPSQIQEPPGREEEIPSFPQQSSSFRP
ncbi:hypothetical protein O181_066786 [Austropuccinia psidii MF-1]|uniref:Uncharacterized protein n=1 Tax=Austropuccinia psidii MF-1 TaxID=1389203 RepID=A0A9Q3ERL1_9BASI|nr:hypothetical protein [Austropuccinia psidii MF-1]